MNNTRRVIIINSNTRKKKNRLPFATGILFLSFDVEIYIRMNYSPLLEQECNIATNFEILIETIFYTKSTSSHTSLINMNPHYRGHSSPKGYPKSSTKTLSSISITLSRKTHRPRSHDDKGSITYRVYVSYFTLTYTYISITLSATKNKKNRSSVQNNSMEKDHATLYLEIAYRR